MCNTEFNLNKWVSQQQVGDVIIEHVGNFTSEYIEEVLPIMEQGLKKSVEVENIRKKTFHVFVECIQNLFHHTESFAALNKSYGSDKVGAIILTKEGELCHITTGNFIKKDKKPILKERIDKLNDLSKEEVKALYRETIDKQDFSAKGGAGVGMIDIVRKTGNKIHYSFYDVKDIPDLVFFSFDICIS